MYRKYPSDDVMVFKIHSNMLAEINKVFRRICLCSGHTFMIYWMVMPMLFLVDRGKMVRAVMLKFIWINRRTVHNNRKV